MSIGTGDQIVQIWQAGLIHVFNTRQARFVWRGYWGEPKMGWVAEGQRPVANWFATHVCTVGYIEGPPAKLRLEVDAHTVEKPIARTVLTDIINEMIKLYWPDAK